ncbi:MAG TPA: hypothetical protein VD862_02730 [Candidatus Paceibacterota bacterium]|nr:hypothetical protein [Candidatus Paceibacterota bacterium]
MTKENPDAGFEMVPDRKQPGPDETQPDIPVIEAELVPRLQEVNETFKELLGDKILLNGEGIAFMFREVRGDGKAILRQLGSENEVAVDWNEIGFKDGKFVSDRWKLVDVANEAAA